MKIFIGGNDPEAIIEEYHDYVGRWILNPFWAFGAHQSRWGYSSLSLVKEVVANYEANKLPLDGMICKSEYNETRSDLERH